MPSADPPVPGPIVECIPNVSEGRDGAVIARLADTLRAAAGVTLMNVHADLDHHRSVFSLLGAPDAVAAAALALAAAAIERIDMRHHRGIHPRVGAVDVVPFVPLRAVSMEDAVALARRLAGILYAMWRDGTDYRAPRPTTEVAA